MVLTTTQSIEQQVFADTTTVSFALQNLENNLQEWQLSIDFLQKERLFLVEMLELSIASQKGDKQVELINFQEKIIAFEKNNVIPFSQQLQAQMMNLIVNNESGSPVELIESYENLKGRWEEIATTFNELKLIAFDKIADNVPISIY
jgi:hypothetical protein